MAAPICLLRKISAQTTVWFCVHLLWLKIYRRDHPLIHLASCQYNPMYSITISLPMTEQAFNPQHFGPDSKKPLNPCLSVLLN